MESMFAKEIQMLEWKLNSMNNPTKTKTKKKKALW